MAMGCTARTCRVWAAPSAEAFPLVGVWSEDAQLDCRGGAQVVPELPIQEFVFAADGTFAVTWCPFESYVDYWGTYVLDRETGSIDLTITGGNNIPDDFDGTGIFALEPGGSSYSPTSGSELQRVSVRRQTAAIDLSDRSADAVSNVFELLRPS